MTEKPRAAAPTGRKKIVQVKERSDDALGHESQNMASTDGAKEVSTARGFDPQGSALPESAITENELPTGWRWVRIREIGNVQLGRQRAPKHQNGANMRPYLRVANVFEDRLDLSDVLTMNFTPREFETFALRANDILLNEGQSLHLVGRPALYRDELPGVCFQNTLIRFRPGPDVEPKFALTIFRGYMHTGKFQKIARWTTNIAHLGAQRFADMPFPLPPLPEQRRIVAEIEKQFTRLEAGVAALKRVQVNLKRYRAAVLKAACEGRLVPTEAELAKTGKLKANFETGEQLLARILTERRQNWQGRGQYKEPAEPDTSGLPRLPEGWVWARLEQLGLTFGGLTKNPKRAKLPKQLPYLRVANVYANELRLEEIEYIGVEDSELEKLLVRVGDLLIVEGNGSKTQIGRLAIWDGSIEPCVHQNHIIKVRPVESRMPKWILYWLQSPNGRHFVELVASSTSGLYTLSVNKVGDLPIAVPPLAEQTRIVAEVERRLSVVEELEAVVSANLQRAARLRQSILQKAFTGKL